MLPLTERQKKIEKFLKEHVDPIDKKTLQLIYKVWWKEYFRVAEEAKVGIATKEEKETTVSKNGP